MVQLEVPTLILLIVTRLNSREAELLKVDLGMLNGIIVECDNSRNGRKGSLCLFGLIYGR